MKTKMYSQADDVRVKKSHGNLLMPGIPLCILFLYLQQPSSLYQPNRQNYILWSSCTTALGSKH